jgi:predicted regulator of Ras-like GTPase activity (Roadblock/LC7/MglB family)
MLCPTALKSLLNQANTGGVDSTLLISREGSVMAHSGNTTDRHAMVTAAVASNVWGAYEKVGQAANLTLSPSKTPTRRTNQNGIDGANTESALRHVILDCTEGRAGVALVPGTDYIVSIFADPACEVGLLKRKLVAIVNYLEEPLGLLVQEQNGSN